MAAAAVVGACGRDDEKQILVEGVASVCGRPPRAAQVESPRPRSPSHPGRAAFPAEASRRRRVLQVEDVGLALRGGGGRWGVHGGLWREQSGSRVAE